MNRTEIINYLINKYDLQSYLKIGLDKPELNYFNVNCKLKECVDPYNLGGTYYYTDNSVKKYVEENILTYKMTSDEFFNKYPDYRYDIIFIDGLHIEDQVDRDITNAYNHLSRNGFIVVHYCLPAKKEHQTDYDNGGLWNGTVWRSIPKLNMERAKFVTVDTDFGVCVIRKTNIDLDITKYDSSDYTYESVFSSKIIRDSVMHVISEDEFFDSQNVEI